MDTVRETRRSAFNEGKAFKTGIWVCVQDDRRGVSASEHDPQVLAVRARGRSEADATSGRHMRDRLLITLFRPGFWRFRQPLRRASRFSMKLVPPVERPVYVFSLLSSSCTPRSPSIISLYFTAARSSALLACQCPPGKFTFDLVNHV